MGPAAKRWRAAAEDPSRLWRRIERLKFVSSRRAERSKAERESHQKELETLRSDLQHATNEFANSLRREQDALAENNKLKAELAARDSKPVDNSEPRLSAEQLQEMNRMLANGECKPKGPLVLIPDVDNAEAIRERLLQPFYGIEAEQLGATKYQRRGGELWERQYVNKWLPCNTPVWHSDSQYRLAKGE